MKYFLSLFAVLSLIGAGCTQSTAVESETNMDAQVEGSIEVEAEESSPVSIEVTTDEGVFVTETGTTADENGVPVTEIVLGEPADVEVNMEVANFSFSPQTITASPGDEVMITFTKNTGFHTFVIDEIDVNFPIAAGETLIFTAPDEPGQYPFYCDIGSHRSMGMEGTLIVQ